MEALQTFQAACHTNFKNHAVIKVPVEFFFTGTYSYNERGQYESEGKKILPDQLSEI